MRLLLNWALSALAVWIVSHVISGFHVGGWLSALIAALVKLCEDNASTLTPDPLHSAFYDSHPPAAARIARLDAVKEHS